MIEERDPLRQTGRTTRQMLEAPKCSSFVWVNDNITYPRALARHLGRTDLFIRPLSWLNRRDRVALGSSDGVTIDHDATIGPLEEAAYEYLRSSHKLVTRVERQQNIDSLRAAAVARIVDERKLFRLKGDE